MNLRRQKRTVYVTLALLLVCSILLASASYAWLALATAPDVSGISTNIGANGSLEIALVNGETYVDPSLITSKIGGSLEANNPLLANVQWGNVLDLSDPSYGLGEVTLIPARLDVSTENLVNANLLTVPSYGEDGRFSQFNTSMASGSFVTDGNNTSFVFDPLNPGYGIRGIGTVAGVSAQEAALSHARTAVMSYSASAEAAIIRFWETHGEDFFYIVHRKAFFNTWEEKEKAVETYYLMANDMLEILDLFDSALRQGIIGYLSSTIASEKEFNAIKEIIENKSMPLSTLFDYIPVSIPSLYTSCIGSLEHDIRQMELIRGQYISYRNGVISLSQINMGITMQGFLNTNASYINGETMTSMEYSEFPLTEDNELTVVTHTPGYIDPYGEVLHSIPLYIGDYNAFFNYDGKSFEAVTLTKSDEDPVLESISHALDALAKDDDNPMQAVKLNEVYGFVMDMAFRCNEESELLLQTAQDFRVEDGSELIDFQGGGSYMRFTSEQMSNQQILLMMDAIRIAFVDHEHNLLGVAKLNTSNFSETADGVNVPLYQYEYTVLETGGIQMGKRMDKNSVLTTLHKNDPTVISVVVWLDGDHVNNSLAAIRDQSMVGVLNLQFASSADLNPAVPGNPADPDGTKPSEPDATVPTQPNPSIPTVPDATLDYYLHDNGNGYLTFYTMNSDGNMTAIFQGCESLTNLDVGNWDTFSATNMSSMFWNCTGLTSLDVTSWNTSNVMDMSYMFYNCTNLTDLDISNWDMSKADTGDMFFNCPAGN